MLRHTPSTPCMFSGPRVASAHFPPRVTGSPRVVGRGIKAMVKYNKLSMTRECIIKGHTPVTLGLSKGEEKYAWIGSSNIRIGDFFSNLLLAGNHDYSLVVNLNEDTRRNRTMQNVKNPLFTKTFRPRLIF